MRQRHSVAGRDLQVFYAVSLDDSLLVMAAASLAALITAKRKAGLAI